jgi:hypothetical protein
MPSPVCQSMDNLIVILSVRRCPNKFMNLTMWELCTFDCEVFRCGKDHYSNSIFIANFV